MGYHRSMPAPRSPSFIRLGCGWLLLSVLLASVLLVFDGLIVKNVYSATAASMPEYLQDRRLSQAIVFLGPVLLLVVQVWACDVAIDWLWPTRWRRPKG